MADLNLKGLQNPLQTDGFEFVEYTAPTAKGLSDLKALFNELGFAFILHS